MDKRIGIGDGVVIDSGWKFRCYSGATVTFVEVARTRDVLPVLPE
jgi:hypothetical protein